MTAEIKELSNIDRLFFHCQEMLFLSFIFEFLRCFKRSNWPMARRDFQSRVEQFKPNPQIAQNLRFTPFCADNIHAVFHFSTNSSFT